MYGHQIPGTPETFDGTHALLRLVDGLAFRYYWATEGLRPEDHGFRPAPDCMSTRELMRHLLDLVFMIHQTVHDAPERELFESNEADALRSHTLERLEEVRVQLARLDDATLATHRVLKRRGPSFPVWNIVNGPLADALTHVGQLNSWRRLNGNAQVPINVFAGLPPADHDRES